MERHSLSSGMARPQLPRVVYPQASLPPRDTPVAAFAGREVRFRFHQLSCYPTLNTATRTQTKFLRIISVVVIITILRWVVFLQSLPA